MSDIALLKGIVPVIDALIKNMALPAGERKVSFKLLASAAGPFSDCVSSAARAVDGKGESLDDALLEAVAPRGDALAILFVDLFADYERTLGKQGADDRLYIELKRVRRTIKEFESRLREAAEAASAAAAAAAALRDPVLASAVLGDEDAD